MDMDAEKKRQLQKAVGQLQHPLDLILYSTEDSEFGRILVDFVHMACSLSKGKLRATKETPPATFPASPCFGIGREGCASITYAAVPEGHQLMPFVKALESLGAASGLPESSAGPPSELPPAEVWVLVSAQCPRCPGVVEAAVAVSIRRPSISLSVIDAQQFPDLAAEYGIKAVPATVIDRSLVLIGSISADRIEELIHERGTEKFDGELIRSYVNTGRLGRAAEELRRGKGRSAVLAMVQELDMSARMSGLVIFEEALGDDPASVGPMVPPLIELLSHRDSRIRGDIADLLGKVRDPRAIPELERLTTDPDTDVAEIAAEALDSIRGQET